MARRTIDPTVKATALAEAQVEGANLVEVARRAGVSLPSIYNWLKKAKVVEVVPETPAA
jgi:transposase-like protein